MFTDDKEKIEDLFSLSKDEFLNSYSYLREEEYDSTVNAIKELINSSLDKDLKDLINAEEEREYLQNIIEQADQENKSVEDIVIDRIDNLYEVSYMIRKKGDDTDV